MTNATTARAPRWRLSLEAVGRAPIDLPEGRHTIGATPASTFLVALPWSCEGVRLRVGRTGVEVRALDPRVPVKVDGQPLTGVRLIPAGKRETLLEIGPVRLRLLDRDRPPPAWGHPVRPVRRRSAPLGLARRLGDLHRRVARRSVHTAAIGDGCDPRVQRPRGGRAH